MILLALLLQAVSEDRVRGELERLASADVEIRQAAEAALVALGEEAVPVLEGLAAGADAETRGRVADIVRRLRWWDHVALWRGRKIDVRRGTAQPSGFSPFAAVVGRRVVDAAPGGMRAVDWRSGRELWTSTPDIDRGGNDYWKVEAGETSVLIRTLGGLACLDAETGCRLWAYPGRWPQAAPLAGGDWVVGEGKEIARRGATTWAVAVPALSRLSAAGPWIFVADEKSTTVLDAATGRDVRRLEGRRVLAAVDGGEGRAIVVENGAVTALRMSDGSRLWTRPGVQDATRLLVEGGRVVVADHMYMCCSIKLFALDLASGAPLWTAPAQGIPTEHSKYRHEARLARVGPHLVLLGEAAAGDYVETFDPATGARISRWASR